jgi:hypothetical protein
MIGRPFAAPLVAIVPPVNRPPYISLIPPLDDLAGVLIPVFIEVMGVPDPMALLIAI